MHRFYSKAPTVLGLDFIEVSSFVPASHDGTSDEVGPRGGVLHYVVSRAVMDAYTEDDPNYEQGPHLGRITRLRTGGREVLYHLVKKGVEDLRSRGYWVSTHGTDVYANKPF